MFEEHEEGETVEMNSSELVQVCAYMAGMYCTEEGVSNNALANTPWMTFVEWMAKRVALIGNEEATEICEKCAVDTRVWRGLVVILQDWQNMRKLTPLWPQISLAHRGIPKTPVEAIGMSVVIRWKDGKSAVISQMVLASMLEPTDAGTPNVLSDGSVCSFLSQTGPALQDVLLKVGVDGLHDQAAFEADVEAFKVLAGLVQVHLPEVRKEFHSRISNLLGILTAFYCPQEAKGPKTTLKVLEEQEAKPLQGGWNA